ncbi:MAG TPA: hypothetical protein VM869_08155 [Enhygromyxa sp.]|nr:hypothetical protein [Enhygromyxa sp.]
MKTRKLTVAAIFVATLAWTGAANAEDPCGAPGELLKSCEIIEEPECHEVCEPDAMLVSCIADAAEQCIAECEDAQTAQCEAGCAGQCKAECANFVVPEEPEKCKFTCSAECMGSCGAWCEKSGDKVTCFAACNHQCSAHCTSSCDGSGFGCEVGCTQACMGSCEAQDARECEVSCQIKATAKCKAELPDKCHKVCDNGGILACDEQFIDIDDIDACLAELEQLGVEVRGPVEALKGGSQAVLNPRAASCSVEDQAKLGLAGALFTLLSFGLGATFLRRRR